MCTSTTFSKTSYLILNIKYCLKSCIKCSCG
nr:MAG TPA: hypothetical protein [Caudoviricetes sp.]